MGWAGFLRKTRPNYVSPMGQVIEVTTRLWVTHGPGWAGLWAGLMRPSDEGYRNVVPGESLSEMRSSSAALLWVNRGFGI
jgi:hypothetical protein